MRDGKFDFGYAISFGFDIITELLANLAHI